MRSTFARRAPLLLLLYPLALLAIIVASATGDPVGPTLGGLGVKAKGLVMFFIGNRQSEIEPCGCVKNQLGGIQYEATIYASVDRDNSLRVDAGAWSTSGLAPEASMKARYALKAMGGGLDLDAVNVSQQDLTMGLDGFKDIQSKSPESMRPLISANIYLREKPEERAFPPFRIVERSAGDKKVRICMVGVTTDIPKALRSNPNYKNPVDKDYIIQDPAASLKKVLEEVKGRADLKVALVRANWEDTVAIAQANPELDVIVTTSLPPKPDSKIDTIGKTKIVCVHNALGKELGKAELIPAENGEWATVGDPEWIGVSPKLPATQAMVDIIDQYKKNTQELIVERPKQVKSVYAGAQYCGSCHVGEYRQWMQTPHARAIDALVSKGSQFDAACLKCHTVGFKQDNGFYNIKDSMPMANVQCESCHGPGSEHSDHENYIRNKSINSKNEADRAAYLAEAKALIPPRKVTAQTCVQCHQGENDPKFVYADKIHKVDHSDMAAIPENATQQIAPGVVRPGLPLPPQMGPRPPMPQQPRPPIQPNTQNVPPANPPQQR